MTSNHHLPVLLDAVIEQMAICPDGKYVDATFGRGGHSQAVLKALGPEGRLLGIDQDWDAVAHAKATITDERFTMAHGNFTNIDLTIAEQGWHQQVNGALFDLGVSSPQLDNAARGFSFMQDGPLDMRMDQQSGIDAATWLSQVSERELTQVLRDYGDERYAKRIAHAIVTQRAEKAITRTGELSELIIKAIPRRDPNKHPATRSFQAIRMAVNQELQVINVGLQKAFDSLCVGGRLLVITFHSLEDRIVKQFFREQSGHDVIPSDIPIRHQEIKFPLKIVGRAIKASNDELAMNPRARSAKLRVAERVL